jgi:hypothetical protein
MSELLMPALLVEQLVPKGQVEVRVAQIVRVSDATRSAMNAILVIRTYAKPPPAERARPQFLVVPIFVGRKRATDAMTALAHRATDRRLHVHVATNVVPLAS